MNSYFVYILASKKNGTLYIGLTDQLAKRLQEHRIKLYDGFIKKYNVDQLVYYEEHMTLEEASKREKQMKKWHRKWKIELNEKKNPLWNDLYPGLRENLLEEGILDSLFEGIKL